MIFDQGFLPLALDTPVSNCKAAAPGILFPRYPPYLVSIPLSATGGGARWETSNSSRAVFPLQYTNAGNVKPALLSPTGRDKGLGVEIASM